MNCNLEIHNGMTTMKYIDCPFCDQQLQQPSIKHDSCSDKPSMINDNCAIICESCGTVNGYRVVKEYIDLYENKYRIAKKYMTENII